MRIFEDILDNNSSKADYLAKIPVMLECEAREHDIELLSHNVIINYDINIEYRSWGIKDIDAVPRGQVELDIQVDNKSEVITVNLDDVKVYWVAGGAYAPLNLLVFLDEDFGVKEVSLKFMFISK